MAGALDVSNNYSNMTSGAKSAAGETAQVVQEKQRQGTTNETNLTNQGGETRTKDENRPIEPMTSETPTLFSGPFPEAATD